MQKVWVHIAENNKKINSLYKNFSTMRNGFVIESITFHFLRIK